jgi:hypothetical protein
MEKQPCAPDDGTGPATMAHIATVRDLGFGAIDAVVALCIALSNAGLIDRADLVKQLDYGLDQQRQRDGEGGRPAARHALTIVRNFFAAPIFTGKTN